MEKLIFPMRSIGISQNYSSTHKSWDLVGSDTGIDFWYAPCTVKVLSILGSGYAHTVLFGTCDKNGNQTTVRCADGTSKILTFACCHMNSLNNFGLAVGKIYPAGAPCYMEGTYGNTSGNHIHMDVATGWQYEKNVDASTGQYVMPNQISPAGLFFKLTGWNVISSNYGTNGNTFPSTSTRYTTTITDVYYLNTKGSQVRVRTSPVNGTVLATIPLNQIAEIISFIPDFQSDGYQWAFVLYNGTFGFSQLDSHNAYTISSSSQALTNRAIYIYNNSSSRTPAIRETAVSGNIKAYVPANTKVLITGLLAGFQSDGYQWVKVKSGSITGYTQMDFNNWLSITE